MHLNNFLTHLFTLHFIYFCLFLSQFCKYHKTSPCSLLPPQYPPHLFSPLPPFASSLPKTASWERVSPELYGIIWQCPEKSPNKTFSLLKALLAPSHLLKHWAKQAFKHSTFIKENALLRPSAGSRWQFLGLIKTMQQNEKQTASFLSILAAALRSRSLRLWNVIHEERNIAALGRGWGWCWCWPLLCWGNCWHEDWSLVRLMLRGHAVRLSAH